MFPWFKSSWKTTLTGLIALASSVIAAFWPEHAATMAKVGGIATGAGLLVARDNNVTSEQAGAAPKKP